MTGADSLGTVLGVWAHPDDEAYLMAGTALLAGRAGSRVACLTATDGDAGESADEVRWPRARLAAVRREELRASLAVLGIADHTSLGLPDGGLVAVPQEHGVGLVADVVDRVAPDTVLTFGPDGITGHPDHVAVAAWAVEAVRRVRGDGCRVLAATKTSAWLTRFAAVNRGVLADPPPRTDEDALTLHVTLGGDDLTTKLHALLAQPSQTSGLLDALGEETYRAWLADEFWVARD